MSKGTLWIASRFAVRDLKMRKFASILTILAIASGVAAFTALRLTSLGIRVAAQEVVRRALAGEIIVYGDGLCDLSELVLKNLERVPGVKRVTPAVLSLSYSRGSMVLMLGVRAEDLGLVVENYYEGEGFGERDKGVAVVDTKFAREKGIRVGEMLFIKSQASPIAYPFRVVGIGKVTLEVQGLGGVTSYVVVPLRDAQRVLNREGYVTMAMLILDDGVSPDAVEESIKLIYPEARIFRREELLEAVSNILSLVDALLLSVTVVGLGVAVLGTANTVMSNVREHARDIAILRAVGASKRVVVSTFVLEGLLYGLIGGTAGVAAGVAAASIVGDFVETLGIMEIPLVLDPVLITTCLLASFVVSSLSALYPSLKAGGISPIKVLKNE